MNKEIKVTARLARLSTKAVFTNLTRCLELLYQRGELGANSIEIKREKGKYTISQIY